MIITQEPEITISNDTITPAEELFMYYKQGMAGSGMTALIECIFKLDKFNQARIALGFPELVTVCNRYREESGYLEDLEERFKRS